jgi:hypothetical protein
VTDSHPFQLKKTKKQNKTPQDDITEVDEGRQVLLVTTLFVVLLTILPYPVQHHL